MTASIISEIREHTLTSFLPSLPSIPFRTWQM
jgi:hypothetical protein